MPWLLILALLSPQTVQRATADSVCVPARAAPMAGPVRDGVQLGQPAPAAMTCTPMPFFPKDDANHTVWLLAGVGIVLGVILIFLLRAGE